MKNLATMICECESMDETQKMSYLSSLYAMKKEQKNRIYAILEEEQKKLSQLEKRYQEEMRMLNENTTVWLENRNPKIHANRFEMGIRPESDRVIYLAGISYSLVEKIKVDIDVICGSGLVDVPVRIVEPIENNISALEQVVKFGLATKKEYRALKKISDILNQK